MNELRIARAVKVAGVTIIPVERINIHNQINATMNWWYGRKEIYALVICTTSEVKAFDETAREINIDQLIDIVPQIADMLDSQEVR